MCFYATQPKTVIAFDEKKRFCIVSSEKEQSSKGRNVQALYSTILDIVIEKTELGRVLF